MECLKDKRFGSKTAKVSAIFAVLEEMTSRKEQLFEEIQHEVTERYGTKTEWKDALVSKLEELTDIQSLELKEQLKAIITLNSEVELLSARNKTKDSHFAEKLSTEFDKKIRSFTKICT